MSKILVDEPAGSQQIFEVGEGGGYFDPSRVLWDERSDGAMPSVTLGGMVRNRGGLVFDQTRMDQHLLAARPAVPPAVSSRQGQLALLDAGYLDDVEMMIASIPDDSERRRAQIEFGATMWERSNPFLQQMWAQLGGDSDGLDELFRAAIKL